MIVHVIASYDDLYEADESLAMAQLPRFRGVEKRRARAVLARTPSATGRTPKGCASRRSPRRSTRSTSPPPAERPDPEAALARLRGVLRADHDLLTVSRMVPIKKVVDALLGMSMVTDEEPSVIGLFASGGPQRKELERMAGVRPAGQDRLPRPVDQDVLGQILPRCISMAPIPGMTLVESALGGSPTVSYDRDALIAPWCRTATPASSSTSRITRRWGSGCGAGQARRPAGRMAARIREHVLPYADLDALYRKEGEAFDEMFARWEGGAGGSRSA